MGWWFVRCCFDHLNAIFTIYCQFVFNSKANPVLLFKKARISKDPLL